MLNFYQGKNCLMSVNVAKGHSTFQLTAVQFRKHLFEHSTGFLRKVIHLSMQSLGISE